MSETGLMRQIRKALNDTHRVRVVRNSVGFDEIRGLRYGLGIGSADLVGILRSGRVFVIEVKTPRGRTRPEQRTWAAAIRRWGGFAAFARSIDEALAALERAENGESE